MSRRRTRRAGSAPSTTAENAGAPGRAPACPHHPRHLPRPYPSLPADREPSGAPARRAARGSQSNTSATADRAESRRRSEEHTSELQSPCNLVCRLLLEKKKQNLYNSLKYKKKKKKKI